ncbi:hypothetical protein [Pseudanabaena sp. 'Roaring Creek']|uniref:hypothetical protein n=1 Tax=Pseudanabaena sp. 'Roaring Creek' TaxID=1681830 RepID=UPI0006D84690|nr:hypothetical protein [Pseudanabaena sp. 'Roaring Creek']
MPISNPIQGQGLDLHLSDADPIAPPDTSKKFWFNYQNKNLFLSIATNSASDWVAIGGDAASILNKILVQNGQVLTTDDHVIFED